MKYEFFDKFAVFITAIPAWLFGIVLAKGDWPTFWACVFPPYAWYLLADHFATAWGMK